ncbi:MAG: lytic transglycosylase domain-containing protein [Ruminococcus sp.]|nr:lytic transglycosylase domain-containing protein [Ruminococcus sp.]
MSHYEKTGNRGHGCCGGIFTLLIVGVVILGLLMFTTDVLKDVEDRILKKFYPQQYSQYVSQYADEYEVEETLVYAVIRTESGFRAEVESSAGARGLMQIMPDTFEWLQTTCDGEVIYTDNELFNPEINIKYGTYYLSMLINHYSGDEKMAVAAYNAGMANVDEWVETYSEDSDTLEHIPYPETQHYVERVEKTKQMYESLYYEDNK